MGYRHIMHTISYTVNWPEWFINKYKGRFVFNEGTIKTKVEAKFYTDEFFIDVQKALNKIGFFKEYDVPYEIYLISEEVVFNRVVISFDKIMYYCCYGYDLHQTDFIE